MLEDLMDIHGLHAYQEKGEQTCSRMIFKKTKKHKHLWENMKQNI